MEAKNAQSIIENEMIEFNYKPFYQWVTRLIDIVGSLCALVFLLPLFIVIAVLIKWDDPKGKVFYKQTRVGKSQRTFEMYKFRTMYHDADQRIQELLAFNEVKGAMFKMKEDPRITKIGKPLRKYSLDELPQMLNVLIGDMSLVGPRPPLEREVAEYTEYDKQRFLVTCGITGLWQISGRNKLSFEEMVELDLEYIRTCCLKNDLKILLKTIKVVIKSEDAY